MRGRLIRGDGSGDVGQSARRVPAPDAADIGCKGRTAMFSRKVSVGDICTRVVSIAVPSLSVEEAARVMQRQHAGSLVVVEEVSPEDRRVVGIVTDRDLVTGVIAAQKDPHGLTVADVMSRSVVTAGEDDSVLDVLAAMRRNAVRRVPVVGSQSRLIGIVTIDDVLQLVAEEMQALAAAVGAAQRHEEVAPR